MNASLLTGFLHRVAGLCAAFAAFAVVLLALLVLASIVSRLVGVYIGGLTEGAGYCMAAAGSLGLSHTFLRGEHIRVDLVLRLLPERTRLRVEQIAIVLAGVVAMYGAWFIMRMTFLSWSYGDISVGSDALPLWLPQIPVAIGFTLFGITVSGTAIASLYRGRGPDIGHRTNVPDGTD